MRLKQKLKETSTQINSPCEHAGNMTLVEVAHSACDMRQCWHMQTCLTDICDATLFPPCPPQVFLSLPHSPPAPFFSSPFAFPSPGPGGLPQAAPRSRAFAEGLAPCPTKYGAGWGPRNPLAARGSRPPLPSREPCSIAAPLCTRCSGRHSPCSTCWPHVESSVAEVARDSPLVCRCQAALSTH